MESSSSCRPHCNNQIQQVMRCPIAPKMKKHLQKYLPTMRKWQQCQSLLCYTENIPKYGEEVTCNVKYGDVTHHLSLKSP